jgi:TetR/AcrR family transcriptional regulator
VSEAAARRGARPRLAAAERRADLLSCACRVFADGSYRGTTTAEIAREAGVTEPILYRHFDSKRDLYLACLRDAWERLHALWERALAEEPDPARWLAALGLAFHESADRVVIHSLWVQAVAEASEDPEIRAYMRGHMREVHAFVTGVIRRSQAEGGVSPSRDAAAEAWVFIAIGFLSAVGAWLGGLLEDDLPAIRASRRLWLTGRP